MDRRERLLHVNNFSVYYGRGMNNDLESAGLAIVEPAGQSVESIKKLQASGTIVVAYQSVIEIDERSKDFCLIKDTDFLKIDGKALTNDSYGTYLLDIRSKNWSEILHHKIGKLLLELGYDGIFLDTMGDIEYNVITPSCFNSLIIEASNFARRLKMDFPDKLFIQNNGLQKLCLYTAQFMDAICWENPYVDYFNNPQLFKLIIKRLEMMQGKWNIKILLLVEKNSNDAYDRNTLKIFMEELETIAKNKGFLLYSASRNYL